MRSYGAFYDKSINSPLLGEGTINSRIKELEKENAELRALVVKLTSRIEELERKLGLNSKNSSKPPSSDPPWNNGKPKKTKKGRKQGGQKGHPPHLKELMPENKVSKLIQLEPDYCPCCQGTHFKDSGEAPLRHQVWDLPPIEPIVTEYRRPIKKCQGCGELVYARLSSEISKTTFGAGVLSIVAVLTGSLNTSKRKACMVINEVFHVPISSGGLSNCEKKISEALKSPYEKAVQEAQNQDIGHADETGWRCGNKDKGWLWSLWTRTAAVFMVAKSRSTEEAERLLGDFAGILVTDRYGAYNFFEGIRQICWAHLLRDFTAMSEQKGQAGVWGQALRELADNVLTYRIRVRDGTLKWKTFQSRVEAKKPLIEDLLEKIGNSDGYYSGKARCILKHKYALWTFTENHCVEPTNNVAERTIRKGVIWRKTSFGTQSERGARYVERVLTINATCQLQKRSFFNYVSEACRNFTESREAPPLFINHTENIKSA